jgi:hypothetical protein
VTLNYVDEEEKARRRLLIGSGADMNTKLRSRLRQMVDDRILELQFDKNAVAKINKEIKLLKKQKRDRDNIGKDEDYIERNIEILSILNQTGDFP